MIDTYIVPENTIVTANGESAPVEIGAAEGKNFLLTLHITRIVEQESLDVSLWGSADGNAWGAKPLLTFPQKFYQGEHPLMLDLAAHPEVKFLRARWHVNRWGRGSETPMFEFSLRLREVPPELLMATGSQTAART